MKRVVTLALAASLLVAVPLGAAPKRERNLDRFFVHPHLETIRVTSIAMLPAVSYDNVTPAERSAEIELIQLLKDTGYRWVSAATARDLFRATAGESILKANRDDLLAHDRLDSLRAGRLCALLRVNGLLAIRVDRAEQLSIQSDQSGRPTTTVQIRAALVDSVGRLVWSAAGSQVAEGPELQAASAGIAGGGFNGMGPAPIQAKNNAPEWWAAYRPMFLRWAPTFPARAGLAGGAPAGEAPADSTSR